MSVKIFLPVEYFYNKENCDIYGEIQINDNNTISYFVIASTAASSASTNNARGDELDLCGRFRLLGHIVRAGLSSQLQRRDVSLSFLYDSETPNIYLNKLSIKPAHTTHVNMFLYDAQRVLQLHDSIAPKYSEYISPAPAHTVLASSVKNGEGDAEQCDDIRMLFYLLQKCQDKKKQQRHSFGAKELASSVILFSLDVMTRIFILFMEWKPINCILKRTVLFDHYKEWRKFCSTGKRNTNIALDRVLGICVMLILLFCIPHPENYLIQVSHFIIKKLRVLLRALKGSPIGLKLNVHLNNLFLDCFQYHTDLWVTFLSLIEPFVRQLFVPIALFGSMGLSYQLALLADLISVISLHAHCFYIYTAILYKVEIKGLQVLWKFVLGKRHNVLKNRVESHNYMNRQLYLATIFFTSLLFLFPTILVYYVVFTSLRLCIYFMNLILQSKRRRILEFPLQILFKWVTRSFFEIESIELQHINHVSSPLLQPENREIKMCVFLLKVQSSSLARVFSCESGVLQELTTNEQTSMKSIFNRIITGKF